MTKIAALTGIGRGDIPRSVRRLEQAQLLRRESRVGASALNAYAVLFDIGEATSGVSNLADSENADSDAADSRIAGQVSAISPSGVSNFAARIDNRPKNRPKNISTTRNRVVRRHIVSSVVDVQFETFWRAFPSRGPDHSNPKKPARLKFEAAVKRGVEPELMIRAAENYAKAMWRSGTDGRYIKTAEVWLNKASWEQYAAEAEPDQPRAGLI